MYARLGTALSILFIVAAPAWGQTPLAPAFTYQGSLHQSGQPFTGTVDLIFTLWDDAGSGNPPAGGIQLGIAVNKPGTPITDGMFTVQINEANEFGGSAFNGAARWLEVSVNATPLAPRQPLTAAPYAAFALNTDRLDGLDSSAFLQSVPLPLTLAGDGTYIIRAENASAANLCAALRGMSTATSGFTSGVNGHVSSPDGRGVYGVASASTGQASGVSGLSWSTGGYGVVGVANAASGSATGVFGESDSTDGRGVYGFATATTGTNFGVYARSNSTAGTGVYGLAVAQTGTVAGVHGKSQSRDGSGIYGEASSGLGSPVGVRGTSASPTGTGVLGQVSTVLGDNNGVMGVSASQTGTGVRGVASAASGATYGVAGHSVSASGYGVYGEGAFGVYGYTVDNAIGRGVYGYAATTSGTNYGVYGRNEAPGGRAVYGAAIASGASDNPTGVRGSASTATLGYGVYAVGDLGASGLKPFRIDHPDDPANKYLLHYAAESPEVINFYRGAVTLDQDGNAEVELPHYFAKINRSPTYQLTPVGAAMPGLHVAEEVEEAALHAGARAEPGQPAPRCVFRISGGVPGGKVCWRVEAHRNDLRVRRDGVRVEAEKTGEERGKYQHPEYYGLPAQLGMDYDAAADRPAVYGTQPARTTHAETPE